MKYIGLILPLLFTLTFAGPTLSPEEAVRIGLQNNFDIQIAKNNAGIARENSGLGRAGLLPVLNATGGYSRIKTEQESNSTQSYGDSETENLNAQLALSWTLFDGFKMFLNRAKFEKLASLGEYNARYLVEVQVISILRGYYNLVQQKQRLRVNRETVEISRERLEKAKIRHEVGGASSTDLLNARVSLNTDRAALMNQELAVQIAQKDLNIAMGQDPNSEVGVAEDIIIPPLASDEEELLKVAMENNSRLLAARRNREIAEKDLQIARAALSPSLSFSGSYGYSDRTVSPSASPVDITTEGTEAILGLNLSFNLFNGFRNKIDIQTSGIAAKNEALRLQKEELDVRGLVMEKELTFRKRLEILAMERENLLAARQNLDLQRDRYETGSTTSLEFRDAQVNYARAELALIGAKFQARISRLEIAQLIGEIDIE